MEKREPSYTVGGSVNWYNHYGEQRRAYISCEKKKREKPRRKVKIYPFECRVPKNNKER